MHEIEFKISDIKKTDLLGKYRNGGNIKVDFEVGIGYEQMKGKGKTILHKKPTQYRGFKCGIKMLRMFKNPSNWYKGHCLPVTC